MNQVDQIKDLQRHGLGPQEIGSRLRIDRKTVARYMARDDFRQALVPKASVNSRLDPFKPKIDEWLEEDGREEYLYIMHSIVATYDNN